MTTMNIPGLGQAPGVGMQQPTGIVPQLAGSYSPLLSPPRPPIQMMPPRITSALDQWAMKNYNTTADQLPENNIDDLQKHILELAENDVEFWKPRNDRMMQSQRLWEVGKRRAGTLTPKNPISAFTHTSRDDIEKDTLGGDDVELNDGYLIVDKLTAMISSAQWGMDVPPRAVEVTDKAQAIEDLLRHIDREMDARYGLALNGTRIRDEAHFACLRGWICGLVVPNPEDPAFPWTDVLEDPLLVYPRYSRNRLVRVIHRYTITALEAKDEFPDAMDFLINHDDEEEMEVTGYYDDTYKCILLASAGSGITQARAGGAGNPNMPTGSSYITLQPLQRHGYKDIDGKPINPWIIVTPRGTPTKRYNTYGKTSSTDKEDMISMIGLDVLHPIKEMILHLEKLASLQLTEIHKGVDPPVIIHFDGVNKPEKLDLGISGENYMVTGAQDARIFETTSMRPDAEPFLTLINDRIQKGTLPAATFGQSNGAMAGYAISLLSQAAQDVVKPLLDGVKLFRMLRYRRLLEMYVTIGAQFAGPMTFPSMDRQNDQMYTGGGMLTAEDIQANGVYVEVTYDDVLPRDRAGLVQAAIAGSQSGLISVYTAMKDWIGIKNPKQEIQRVLEDLNYRNPAMQQVLAQIAAERSGSDILREAAARLQQQQLAAQQAAQAAQQGGQGGQQGGQGGQQSPISNMNSADVPSNQQVGNGNQGGTPANVNPVLAAADQMNNVSASLNVGNGASAPSPDNSAAVMPAMLDRYLRTNAGQAPPTFLQQVLGG